MLLLECCCCRIILLLESIRSNRDLESCLCICDLESCLCMLDLESCLGRADLDCCLGRVDLESCLGRVDLDSCLGKVDLDSCLGRVDLESCLAMLGLESCLLKWCFVMNVSLYVSGTRYDCILIAVLCSAAQSDESSSHADHNNQIFQIIKRSSPCSCINPSSGIGSVNTWKSSILVYCWSPTALIFVLIFEDFPRCNMQTTQLVHGHGLLLCFWINSHIDTGQLMRHRNQYHTNKWIKNKIKK